MMDAKYNKLMVKAVRMFWDTKRSQQSASVDKSRRGAVLGGKQMDGFLELLRKIAVDLGVPEDCIHTSNTYLPGYFRSSKNWDFLIVSPKGTLVAVVELKSQVGSYGNNFNNRTEEALGSAVDLWTAFREHQIPFTAAPWVGYLIMVGRDEKSLSAVTNNEPHFPVLDEFRQASYIDRYAILCRKLVLERHYSSAALLWTEDARHFGDVTEEIGIEQFINSFIGNIYAHKSDF